MSNYFSIRPLESPQIPLVSNWARQEGFAPGDGDVSIYQHTDRQGLWVGWINNKPIGCIAGVKYNPNYGFIGLYLVIPKYRGQGYGLQLWRTAINHLKDVTCIGLEAALDRVNDYSKWGFKTSSETTRWHFNNSDTSLFHNLLNDLPHPGINVVEASKINSSCIQEYDAKREPSPRPHFLTDWLDHPSGKVLTLVDQESRCHGFGRIRPCLLKKGFGWRIGPLLADNSILASLLIKRLLQSHPGEVLIDSPGLNPYSNNLLSSIGFTPISNTLRMYKGDQPPTNINEVYGLACLELG